MEFFPNGLKKYEIVTDLLSFNEMGIGHCPWLIMKAYRNGSESPKRKHEGSSGVNKLKPLTSYVYFMTHILKF